MFSVISTIIRGPLPSEDGVCQPENMWRREELTSLVYIHNTPLYWAIFRRCESGNLLEERKLSALYTEHLSTFSHELLHIFRLFTWIENGMWCDVRATSTAEILYAAQEGKKGWWDSNLVDSIHHGICFSRSLRPHIMIRGWDIGRSLLGAHAPHFCQHSSNPHRPARSLRRRRSNCAFSRFFRCQLVEFGEIKGWLLSAEVELEVDSRCAFNCRRLWTTVTRSTSIGCKLMLNLIRKECRC